MSPRHTMDALALVADALGVARAGRSRCAVCGPSFRGVGGSRVKMLGVNFADQDLLRDPDAPTICEGCVAILGGKPGRVPPPLRMVSLRATAADGVERLAREDWWPILRDSTRGAEVLSWATSRKKHHVLRAGVSRRGEWRIGSDDGTCAWSHDASVLDAIETLRRIGATKGAILAGRYRPAIMAGFAEEIERAERALTGWRGTPAFDLLVYAAPDAGKEKETPKGGRMLDVHEERAVDLLARFAWAARMRRTDGLRFWGGYFEGRVARCSRLGLNEFASRLMTEIGVDPTAMDIRRVAVIGDEDGERAMEAIRRKPALLVALAFDAVKRRRGSKRMSYD